jgi:hypothetical protein
MATRKTPAPKPAPRARRGNLGHATAPEKVLVIPASASTIMKRLGLSREDIAKARLLAAWSDARVRSGR